MTALRKLGVVAVVGACASLLSTALIAAPAAAHGAPDNPVSRTVACSPEGGQHVRSAACRAAIAANGNQTFTDWDNLRVANVRGRNRERIPDGRLCSGGLDTFKGLDLARADWPATRLTAGAAFTFRYKETIPHKGTFKVYVTRDGYDPAQPLRWSDLEAEPFLTVKDPALRNNSYVFGGKLPAGKAGRHLIYMIWQNSDTPDTYYSCSDAIFSGATGGSGNAPTQSVPGGDQSVPGGDQSVPGGSRSESSAGRPATDAGTANPATGADDTAGPGSRPKPVAAASELTAVVPLTVAAAAALLAAVIAIAVYRRRRRAPERTPLEPA